MVGEDRQDGKFSTLENLVIPKNRSSSSLVTDKQKVATSRIRFSIDSDRSEQDLFMKSPVVPEHEHGLGNNGLRRIRRQPASRAPTVPPSPEMSFTLPARSSSMSLNLTHSRTFPTTGPQSPTLTTFGEDLTRFPSESLHSFSFTHQSEEVLHDRQEMIKRSVEFVGDKIGRASHDPRVLNAQAKATGDAEMQSIVELLSRANVLGDPEDTRSLGLLGPLTGPAHLASIENIFEKGFALAQSPGSEEGISPGLSMPETLNSDSRTTSSQSKLSSAAAKDLSASPTFELSESPISKSVDDSSIPTPKTMPTPRPGGMKRSETDTGPLYLRAKLEIALAKPYLAKDASEETQLLSPPLLPTFGKQVSQVTAPSSNPAAFSKHRWTPAAQCLFTSEAQSPYTMQSANDLACLVFGVRKDQIRKLSMLEMIRPDRRQWLSDRLNAPGSEATAKAKDVPLKSASRKSPSPSTSLAMRGGLTAMLLSKPPSKYSNAWRRAQTDDGSGSSISKAGERKTSLHHQLNKSRGVLLCGDVVPIQKQNGHHGAATLWVKEKKGGLIWVLEEIVEDVAHLTLDAQGKVLSATGAISVLWGDDSIDRKDIRKLIPKAPMKGFPRTPDYEAMKKVEHYTVRNCNGYNLPASLSVVPSLGEVSISTFPHIAGIMVLNSETLDIFSSNSVFSAALFGYRKPDGLHITELIPQFRKLLDFLIDEEDVDLVDGIVVPEHSFRRARAMIAIREGSKDPAALFLKPIGLTAKHRDGGLLNIDVQMRVVRSEIVSATTANVIAEVEEDQEIQTEKIANSEVVYALWITYSRNLHSLAPSGLPVSPLLSRPPTPPRQPSPGQDVTIISPDMMHMESPKSLMTSTSLMTDQIQEAFLEPISDKFSPSVVSIKQEPPESKTEEPLPVKKTVNDFQILEDMGQGAYGQVKLARYKKPPGQKVVLKYVTKKRILVDTWTRDRKLGTVPLEIHVLNYLRKDGLRHPNIVEMLDFFEDNTNYYIEMVPHGLPGMDLFDYIEMRATMEEAECRNIFRQVVSALYHLHTKAFVVHRDIKDENIVLDGDNNVKLIDFGSAAYIKSGPFDVFVGTIDYAAPEVLQGRSYRGKEQDVWALGILLYTIIYKENPFYSVDEILDRELRVPWIMSSGSIELVRAMLNRDVEQRITIEDVVRHPWTRGEDGWTAVIST